ncbi:transferrin receptor protein 2-like, partial [Passer montanus]|uniref:transferrin receptor protein 2-like n=1 Tax=Passer montanus TaxID=9160 RepID=UPI00195FCB95
GAVSLRWVGPGGEELERLPLDPEAFCAWSAPGTATGGLVYAHFGRPQDLAQLRARGVGLRGRLALLRMGRGSPAQQNVGVAMPEEGGAMGIKSIVGVAKSGVVGGCGQCRGLVGGATNGRGQSGGAVPGGGVASLTRPRPDCYIIVGAQRDSLGPGAAASALGTALLLELARFFAAIGREGEGGVESPNEGGRSLLEQLRRPGRRWESDVIRPLDPQGGAFPFAAAAGVPALELAFEEAGGGSYAALGTREDTFSRLGTRLRGRLPAVTRAVSLCHCAGGSPYAALGTREDTFSRLGTRLRGRLPAAGGSPYAALGTREDTFSRLGTRLRGRLTSIDQCGPARGLWLQCLSSARGGVVRAAAALRRDMAGADSGNERLNRGFNARLMAVRTLGTPGTAAGDSARLRLALLAWTLRGTAGALAGDSGDIGGGLGDGGDCGDLGDGGGGLGDIGDSGDIGGILGHVGSAAMLEWQPCWISSHVGMAAMLDRQPCWNGGHVGMAAMLDWRP